MMSASYFADFDKYVAVNFIARGENKGVYATISEIGPDDPNPTQVKITDEVFIDIFMPKKIKGQNRIYFTGQHMRTDGYYEPIFSYSDDVGLSWVMVIVTLPCPPSYGLCYPNKGKRWCINSGCEPNVTEIEDGKLMMLLRTSTDYFYQCFSYDNGKSWTGFRELLLNTASDCGCEQNIICTQNPILSLD